MFKELFFMGCDGFGDNVCQRILIKGLAEKFQTIYLRTPAPEFYWDIPNVKFIYPMHLWRHFRVYRQNVKRQKEGTWASVDLDNVHKIHWVHCRIPYANKWMIMDANEAEARKDKLNREFFEAYDSLSDFEFTFPLKESWVTGTKKLLDSWNVEGKKVCLVNPPTIRRTDCAVRETRNPKLEYFQYLIDKYKEEYYYVGLAYTEEDEEWFDGKLTGIDKRLVHGEASLPIVFGLTKLADMMIVYPSFFSLLGIAIKTKCLCIFGGYRSPEELWDEKMGLENFESVAPIPFDGYNREIPKERIVEKFEELRSRDG
jgi:ADP-heptose:LPS heptosyltransferase